MKQCIFSKKQNPDNWQLFFCFNFLNDHFKTLVLREWLYLCALVREYLFIVWWFCRCNFVFFVSVWESMSEKASLSVPHPCIHIICDFCWCLCVSTPNFSKDVRITFLSTLELLLSPFFWPHSLLSCPGVAFRHQEQRVTICHYSEKLKKLGPQRGTLIYLGLS